MKIQKLILGIVIIGTMAVPASAQGLFKPSRIVKVVSSFKGPRVVNNIEQAVRKAIQQGVVRSYNRDLGVVIMNDDEMTIRPAKILRKAIVEPSAADMNNMATRVWPVSTAPAREAFQFQDVRMEIVDDPDLSLRVVTQPADVRPTNLPGTKATSEVRESFPDAGLQIMNDADLSIRPINETADNRPLKGIEKVLEASVAPVSLPTTLMEPVREHLPGLGYILDDADGTFVPEK